VSFPKREEPSLLTISIVPFVTSLGRRTFNSYDKSWFICQSLLSHMDVLSLVVLWYDVSPKDSSMVEVESPHDSFKPYKISKFLSNFPCCLQIAMVASITCSKLKLSFCFIMRQSWFAIGRVVLGSWMRLYQQHLQLGFDKDSRSPRLEWQRHWLPVCNLLHCFYKLATIV